MELTQQYHDLLQLHQHIGVARFGHKQPWKVNGRNIRTADQQGLYEFQREVQIQIEEIATLLERFQERVEEAEIDEQQLSHDLQRQSEQIELIQTNLADSHTDLVARQTECEKIVKDAQDRIDMLRDLINQGREKASLEATVNKLEKDLSYAIMALDEAKVQGSQESEERMAITRSSERNMRKLNDELEGLRRKNKALQRANEDFENRLKYETEQREKISNDLRKLQRRYDELRDEKSVIDPVHSQLKTKLEEATFRAETLQNSLDMLSKERDERLKRADGTISHLESELSKVKSSWMHDVEMMSQIRHERDSLQTNFSLLEQKWKKMCDENSKLKDKVEELKIEARTNLEASRHNPTPDRTTRTATGSLPRFEMEYQRQLETMQKNYEQEIEKLIEASDYLREKLESERQWSQNLQEANKKLNEQLEVYLKKTDSV